jgi:hypothetical protein
MSSHEQPGSCVAMSKVLMYWDLKTITVFSHVFLCMCAGPLLGMLVVASKTIAIVLLLL